MLNESRQIYKAYIKKSTADKRAIELNLEKPEGWNLPFAVVENYDKFFWKWEVVCLPNYRPSGGMKII
jgi:hypothetical protein